MAETLVEISREEKKRGASAGVVPEVGNAGADVVPARTARATAARDSDGGKVRA